VACKILREKCPCGRTGVIIQPGDRLDGRLRVNEMPLYECQIAEVLAQTRAAGSPFTVEVQDRRLVIRVEMNNALFADMMWPIMEVQGKIQSEFLSRLGIEAEVRFGSKRG
jgi:phenylacetate-coenzyme A ligase PaaK-like adenylate-forming protein